MVEVESLDVSPLVPKTSTIAVAGFFYSNFYGATGLLKVEVFEP